MKTHLPQATLSREEALQLWLSERSEYAKEQMVLANQNLVISEMKKMNLKKDEDLFMQGIYGLCIAVMKFDKEKEVAFSSFAVPVIRNEIIRTFVKKRIEPIMSVDEVIDETDGLTLKNSIPDETDYEDFVLQSLSIRKMTEKSFLKLTPPQKKIIKLLYSGFNQREIAKMLNLTHQNVSGIVVRARKRMEKERWNDLLTR